MAGFPFGIAALDLQPQFSIETARSDGGFGWDVESADAFWRGSVTTGKLDHDRLQDWEGFIADAIDNRTVIDFVDPVYSRPGFYRETALPGSWDGSAAIVDLTNTRQPVLSGLPVGLVLRRGDRLSASEGAANSYHMVTKPLVVSSATEQAVDVSPLILPNVMAEDSAITFVDPVIKLMVEVNSWRAPRRARVQTVGSFSVYEAPVVL